MLERIGHNRTIDLAETVRDRLTEYCEALEIADKITKKAQLEALAALYAIDYWFNERPKERDSFYAVNAIKVDPRARHVAQPLVKHFLVSGTLTKSLRNKVTLWSGAITEAHRQDVQPEELIDFINSTVDGVTGASGQQKIVHRAVPVPPELLDTLNTAHGIREAQKSPKASKQPIWDMT